MIRDYFRFGGAWTVLCEIPKPFRYNMMLANVVYELDGEVQQKELLVRSWDINELDSAFTEKEANILRIEVRELWLKIGK